MIAQLNKGADFTKLVDKYSVDPARRRTRASTTSRPPASTPTSRRPPTRSRRARSRSPSRASSATTSSRRWRTDEGQHQVAGRRQGADQVPARGSAQEQVRRRLVRGDPEPVREEDLVRDRLQPAAHDDGHRHRCRRLGHGSGRHHGLVRMIVALGPGGSDPLGALRPCSGRVARPTSAPRPTSSPRWPSTASRTTLARPSSRLPTSPPGRSPWRSRSGPRGRSASSSRRTPPRAR